MNSMQSFATRQNSSHEASNGGHVQSTGGTFTFRKRWCQIDWRTLASVDIDRVVREMDFQTLQQNIFNVAFCNIDAEEFHSLDPNFVKLFKLAQLIIEYLMHSQQYLQDNMSSLEQQLQKTTEELQLSRSEVKARVEEVKKVKKENKKRKKVIEAYQDMMNAGATGLHACAVCYKEFVSAEFMQSHMQRRHPDHLSTHNRAHTEHPAVVTADMQKSLLDQMTNKLRETEEHLKQEMANREHRLMEENAREMEQWKRREAERHEQEVKKSVEPLVTELNKIQQEKVTMEQELKKQEAVIQALQSQQQSIQQANIIEQQNMTQTRKRKRREEEAAEDKAAEMKQLLETQMNMMQEQMKKQEKQWKKRMQEVTRSHQQQLTESNQKISLLEESLHHAEHPSLDPTILNTIQDLQQKVHKQEEQISKQQQKRNVQQMRSASASPVSQPATPVKTATAAVSAMYQQDSDTGSESETAANMLTVSSLTATMGAQLQQLQQTTQPDEGEDTDNDNDSVPGGEDETDTAVAATEFTPFQHRPMIKTRFSHNQKMLANMQHETSVILEQAFTQRGVPKDTLGLSDTMLEDKLRNLAIERQKRIQSHANFTEHRERLVQELNQMVTATYTPTKQVTPTKQHRGDKSRGHSPPPAVSTSGGSLPTTPTKRHSKPPLVSKLPTSSTPPVATPSSSVVRTQPTPAIRVDDSSLSEESETDSVLEGAPPSTAPPPQGSIIAPPSSVKVIHMTSEQDDSPWDSESEASGDDVGVTARPINDNKQHDTTVTTVKPFEPSSDSDETFSLTEVSEIPAGEKARSHYTTTTAGVKPAGSRGTTSLTTVTAVDYDDMSDFDSDLEITQLT